MQKIEALAKEVIEKLKNIEDSRNDALSESRKVIRASKQVIHAVHQGDDGNGYMDSMKELMSGLIDKTSGEPSVFYGHALEDAMMEFSEAAIFKAVAEGKEIPSYSELGITPQTWALGLCDSLGELRRLLLTCLMVSDLDKAKKIFSDMEEISETIMIFDIPDAIAPIRRKQDIARGIMERSRSDLALAITMSR
jgi:translin